MFFVNTLSASPGKEDSGEHRSNKISERRISFVGMTHCRASFQQSFWKKDFEKDLKNIQEMLNNMPLGNRADNARFAHVGRSPVPKVFARKSKITQTHRICTKVQNNTNSQNSHEMSQIIQNRTKWSNSLEMSRKTKTSNVARNVANYETIECRSKCRELWNHRMSRITAIFDAQYNHFSSDTNKTYTDSLSAHLCTPLCFQHVHLPAETPDSGQNSQFWLETGSFPAILSWRVSTQHGHQKHTC